MLFIKLNWRAAYTDCCVSFTGPSANRKWSPFHIVSKPVWCWDVSVCGWKQTRHYLFYCWANGVRWDCFFPSFRHNSTWPSLWLSHHRSRAMPPPRTPPSILRMGPLGKTIKMYKCVILHSIFSSCYFKLHYIILSKRIVHADNILILSVVSSYASVCWCSLTPALPRWWTEYSLHQWSGPPFCCFSGVRRKVTPEWLLMITPCGQRCKSINSWRLRVPFYFFPRHCHESRIGEPRRGGEIHLLFSNHPPQILCS